MDKQLFIKSDSAGKDTGSRKPKAEKSGVRTRVSKKIRKDITICFRTSPDVRNYIETIALQMRQSLSYVIESIIYQHQQDGGSRTTTATPIASERRRYNRKAVALPALISASQFQDKGYDSGTVLDISLGGIRFAIPKKTSSESRQSDQPTEYNVVFTLPDQSRSMAVRCRPQNVSDAPDEIHVGAAFVDADFGSYQNLQKYLI
jgi:hypothetical protein